MVGRLVEITARKAIVESELIVNGSTTATGSAVLVRLKDDEISQPRYETRPIVRTADRVRDQCASWGWCSMVSER